ncbi:uncharacterized protein LACBIDRAFT_333862 [Laccaria bicolor S238N-H82]|uniref:Predicted protein n=1 Tax=Laccaria bicolor (strain S238N-H82 / ATCC MYA-4686) TaxID=486041 RepID=B0DXB4_LACBS|nr:uncharacterized protein LACBIDRAFT_333862 [Laccaria bicolor S238N-H82]EDR00807.1 predicted protein [Laccaria bicolor S238N-H82]|eukprot:XP_001888599.1 predicted protein [Laccaria bicolor S238N-H82]
MDILFMDTSGGVPSFEFRVTGQHDWVAFNASNSTIPIEAMEYKVQRGHEHRSKGPTGIYLDMEWGLDLDWYDSNASWHPYIPLRLVATTFMIKLRQLPVELSGVFIASFIFNGILDAFIAFFIINPV